MRHIQMDFTDVRANRSLITTNIDGKTVPLFHRRFIQASTFHRDKAFNYGQ